jgi:hypothetical protein
MQGTGQTSNRIVMVYLEPCTGDNDPSFKLGPGFLRATYSGRFVPYRHDALPGFMIQLYCIDNHPGPGFDHCSRSQAAGKGKSCLWCALIHKFARSADERFSPTPAKSVK